MAQSKAILRNILAEVRKSRSNVEGKSSPMVTYIMQQYRKYQVTDQQLCKAQEEMTFLAETYLTYLKSLRQFEEINECYNSKGERSVRDTANLVGFKLPHDPK